MSSYLDLLKLVLTDSLNPAGSWTGPQPGKHRLEPEWLGPERMHIRKEGRDWPLDALTMIGTDRLNDLQWCVETLVADGVPGDLIECGVWRGGAAMLMRATLNELGEGRTVWLADSFQGFRVDVHEEEGLSEYSHLEVPLVEVKANFAHLGLLEGVRFLGGYFEASLVDLRNERWSLIRIDCDTSHGTTAVLEMLYPGLLPGGFVVLDDYMILPQVSGAVAAYRKAHGIDEPIEEIDWNFARWRKRG